MIQRLWLDVPFAEKDEAKAVGALWDGAVERWYAPRPGMEGLQRWAALPDLPDLLPGEDRSFGSGLFVDLVPSSCWFTNVRSCVVPRDWERLRRMINDRASRRCETCGRGKDRELKRWLEAHERWHFDDTTHTQVLRRLVCLCTDCHQATHFGLAEVKGKRAQALAHLCSITGMTTAQAEQHVRSAFELWRRRSTRTWTLDLGILTDSGIQIASPPAASDRAAAAKNTLRTARPAPTRRTSPPPRPAATPPLPRPARVNVAPQPDPEKVNALLDAWAERGRWITIPPWTWFCHMCDSNTHPPFIAHATVRRNRWGRREIICQPYEWLHDFHHDRPAEQRAITAAGTAALSAPGTAARWDRDKHRFVVVSGRQIDWRTAKQQQRQR